MNYLSFKNWQRCLNFGPVSGSSLVQIQQQHWIAYKTKSNGISLLWISVIINDVVLKKFDFNIIYYVEKDFIQIIKLLFI